MEGRSWEQGLHQLIEVKEGCEITGEMETMGRISYQRFFRRYLMLGGMSGTVNEVAGELRDVYGNDVATIPTNRPNRRQRYRERLLASEDDKWRYVVERIRAIHAEGRPVLVGTRSVVASEQLSELLTQAGLPHEVLNARRDKYEAGIVAEAGVRGRITVATNMAGRGTDIKLGDGVTDIGGLHVIATERHEARRIDRQLFGRCARQGDPGSYEEIASLEDQLVHIHLSDWLKRVAHKLLESGSPLGERGAMMLVARAQMKAQGRAGRMRVQMQKMDEYLSNVLAFTGRLE
jgi:preprotein translocase subunit SecA